MSYAGSNISSEQHPPAKAGAKLCTGKHSDMIELSSGGCPIDCVAARRVDILLLSGKLRKREKRHRVEQMMLLNIEGVFCKSGLFAR